MPRCVAVGCNENGSHHFPRDVCLRKLWEKATKLANFKATRNSRLCSKHFKESDYQGLSSTTGKSQVCKHLRKGVVPSIFSWTKTATATRPLIKHVSPTKAALKTSTTYSQQRGHSDHTYFKNIKTFPSEDVRAEDLEKHATVMCPTKEAEIDINSYGLLDSDYSPEPLYDAEESMYYDDVQVIEKPLPVATSPAALAGTSDLHEGIVCNVCKNEVIGYRYVCVECCDWDLCGQCEARAAHPQHYVLRVAHTREHEEVLRVVEAVRQTVRQARGELMSLQLEVSADEQRGGGAALDEDDDNKDHVRQSLGLSVASPGAPSDPLEYCEEKDQERTELTTINNKVREHVSDSSDLEVEQENDSHLSGLRRPVNVYKESRTTSHFVPEKMNQMHIYPQSLILKSETGRRSLCRSALTITSVPTEPDDNLIRTEVDIITMDPLPPTAQLVQQLTPTQTINKTFPEMEYIKTNKVNTTYFSHDKKLLGLAQVKLKRVSGREAVEAMKRQKKEAQNPTYRKTLMGSTHSATHKA